MMAVRKYMVRDCVAILLLKPGIWKRFGTLIPGISLCRFTKAIFVRNSRSALLWVLPHLKSLRRALERTISLWTKVSPQPWSTLISTNPHWLSSIAIPCWRIYASIRLETSNKGCLALAPLHLEIQLVRQNPQYQLPPVQGPEYKPESRSQVRPVGCSRQAPRQKEDDQHGQVRSSLWLGLGLEQRAQVSQS